MIPASLIAIAIAAFTQNEELLRAPGCSPTWLTVSAALCGFAPFFVGVTQATARLTGGPLTPRWQQAAAAVAGVVAIALSFAPQWALACPPAA